MVECNWLSKVSRRQLEWESSLNDWSVWPASEEEGGDKNFQDLAQPLLHSSRQLLSWRCERPTPLKYLIIQGEADTVVSSKGKNK